MTAPAHSDLELKVRGVRDLLRQGLNGNHRLTYASSLGAESVVLTDLIASDFPQIDIFTIDTGRLPEETHALLEQLERRYRLPSSPGGHEDATERPERIRVVYPDALALERLVGRDGINGFYESLEARLECCRVRKIEPFRRAILGYSAWITGVRRRHSAERARTSPIEWDAEHGLQKISPLLDWTDGDVWQYIRSRGLPYNSLLDQGYTSIGCAPCTRAVRAGEDFRAGRWWWERSASRECGLQGPRKPAASIAIVAT
jgi:phosphoadenosine phosphosulfate reductase